MLLSVSYYVNSIFLLSKEIMTPCSFIFADSKIAVIICNLSHQQIIMVHVPVLVIPYIERGMIPCVLCFLSVCLACYFTTTLSISPITLFSKFSLCPKLVAESIKCSREPVLKLSGLALLFCKTICSCLWLFNDFSNICPTDAFCTQPIIILVLKDPFN